MCLSGCAAALKCSPAPKSAPLGLGRLQMLSMKHVHIRKDLVMWTCRDQRMILTGFAIHLSLIPTLPDVASVCLSRYMHFKGCLLDSPNCARDSVDNAFRENCRALVPESICHRLE